MKKGFDPGSGACRDLVKLVGELNAPMSKWGAWESAMELMFYSLTQQEERWQETKARVTQYDSEFDSKLAQVMSGCMAEYADQPRDILGRGYQAFGMGDDRFGQFFTPDCVATAIAKMMIHDTTPEMWEKPGGLRIMEPCIGAGVLVIQALNELKETGGLEALNRTTVVGVDKDRMCCMMSAIQIWWWMLMQGGIGQVWIYHGDSLIGEDSWDLMTVFGVNKGLHLEVEPSEPSKPTPVVPNAKPGDQMVLF